MVYKTFSKTYRNLTCMVLLWIVQVNADVICSFSLSKFIEYYSSKSVNVPLNTVSLNTEIKSTGLLNLRCNTTGPDSYPSIMILIDNSNSMNGMDNAIALTDVMGYRFKLAQALIDSLYRKYPKAEIGLSVFGEYLFFDTADLYIQKLPYSTFQNGAPSSQGYVPMHRLDSIVNGNIRWIDVLTDFLTTKDTAIENRYIPNPLIISKLVHNPRFQYSGFTNVNVAFETVKIEMAKTLNKKENQRVLFF